MKKKIDFFENSRPRKILDCLITLLLFTFRS